MYRIFPATSELAEVIAYLYNKVFDASGIGCWHPRLSAGEVERLLRVWSSGDRVVGVLEVGGSVEAVGWGWVGANKAWVSAIVDPSLPGPLALDAYKNIIKWIISIISKPRSISIALVNLGVYYSPMFWTALDALNLGPADAVREYTIMEAPPSGKEPRGLPSGFRVLVLREPPREQLLAGVVNVVNDAFGIYPDHEEWRLEEAKEWISTIYERRRGAFTVIALHGDRVAGVALAYPIETICGEIKVYLSTLAVARNYQGRGLGKYLVERVRWETRLQGARSVVLDSEPLAEGLYYRLGFTPIAWWARTLVSPTILDG